MAVTIQPREKFRFRLVFNGQLFEPACNALRSRIAQILERPDFGDLTIIFSSEGGNTDQGLSLYNFIRALPVPIHLHAAGHVGSMAIPVFLAGHERTCAPFSRFFFHAYDWGFDKRQITDGVTEALERLRSDIELSNMIAERHTSLPKKRLKELYASNVKPTIMAPEEAQKVGIVSDIRELNPEGLPEPDVNVWTVSW